MIKKCKNACSAISGAGVNFKGRGSLSVYMEVEVAAGVEASVLVG